MTAFKLKLAGAGSTFRLIGGKKGESTPDNQPANDVGGDDIPF